MIAKPVIDGIFISYRRVDTGVIAHEIADNLKQKFGEQVVFIDVSDIDVGTDWRVRIDDALHRSLVVLVLIGKNWITEEDRENGRRIYDPEDIVRHEIASAIGLGRIVIPVSVDGAGLPRVDTLPDDLKDMLELNGTSYFSRSIKKDAEGKAADADEDNLARTISRIMSEEWDRTRERNRPILTFKTSPVLESVRKVLINENINPRITRKITPDKFLRQDPAQDVKEYFDEQPLAANIPYVEEIEFCDEIEQGNEPAIEVRMLRGNFPLQSWGTGDGDPLREAALTEFLRLKPKTFDGPAVRVDRFEITARKLTIHAQKATYFDQLRSNLILDFRGAVGSGRESASLRSLLRQEFGGTLPPLSDRRLANTLGVAALILIRSPENVLSPYLVARTKDTAVFNYGGEWHCTASGVAEFPIDDDRIPYFIRDTMYKELDEEVGLLESDLEFMKPVAFCREMARGGKPQFFFIGVTSLDPASLEEKISHARKRAKDAGDIIENMRPLLRRPAEMKTVDAMRLFDEKGFTSEAAALLHYFFKLEGRFKKN